MSEGILGKGEAFDYVALGLLVAGALALLYMAYGRRDTSDYGYVNPDGTPADNTTPAHSPWL